MYTTHTNSRETLANLTSRTIEWLRFPMAAMVVLLHTGALGIGSTQPVYRILSILTSAAFCRLAVPCFFFVSGYLFFSGMQEWNWQGYMRKLKKRVRTLFVPYVLWNLLAAVVIYLFSVWKTVKEGSAPVTFAEHISGWGGLWDAHTSFDGPLWFIRHLMLLCLFSPLVWWLVKHFGLFWIGACTVALIFSSSFEGICTFSAGAFFQISGKNILREFGRIRIPAYILSVLFLSGIMLFYENTALYLVFRGLFIICGIVSAFNLVSAGLGAGKLKVRPLLGQSSFFIFAAHNIIILHEIAKWVVLHLIPGAGTELYNCIDLFLRPTIAVLICVFLYWLMSKVAPGLLALLTGGRTPNHARGVEYGS